MTAVVRWPAIALCYAGLVVVGLALTIGEWLHHRGEHG